MRPLNFPTQIVTGLMLTPLLTVSGCLNRDTKPLNPCIQSGVAESVRVTSIDKVDLLLVIDNSQSMAEEQASLTVEIPNIVRVLASGDLDGDTMEDFPPVKDLRIGIISTDIGVGGVPSICTGLGDDALLQTDGNGGTGCLATYPKFLEFEPAAPGADPNDFADGVNCVATLGTGGCGFEQQLESALKATIPSDCTDPWCTFVGDGVGGSTVGHGGPAGQNADGAQPAGERSFVRDDALLAMIFLTDEEDCSARDPGLFDTVSDPAPYPGLLNLRCSTIAGQGYANDPRQPVHPISRFVDGYLALKPSAPDLLVYAVIAGVPTDLTIPPNDGNPAVTFDQILAADAMIERPSTGMVGVLGPGQVVEPSCDRQSEGRGVAFPPRRFVQVAKELDARGANAIVQSICQDDFSPAVSAIIEKIADVLGGACLPRRLNPDNAGFVECDVVETLPLEGTVTRCDQIQGRVLIGTDPLTNAEICRVDQVSGSDTNNNGFVDADEATGPGWFYDDFTQDVLDRCGNGTVGSGQRISYVRGFEAVTGTQVRLECLQPIINALENVVDVDSPCPNPNESCTQDGAAPGLPGVTCARALTCDPVTNTFEIVCAADADCPSGFRCDTERPMTEGLGPICVNPTCG